MEYYLKRICEDCKNVDSFELTKVDAAFELYDSSEIWHTPCSKCRSVNCESIEHSHPKLDRELLDIWGNDLKINLMEQDEELFLAEIEYLPLILQAIDESKYFKSKINILIESLCVLLYDNTVQDDCYSSEENKERQRIANIVKPELISRKEEIIEADTFIMDYIKEVVYPQIGIR